ncbi:MAG TPA: UPF0175 family protein [Bacteroidetes bacterium]|nr:UPF0175 family protein [Bacteroidota bacterium]
MDQGIVQSSGLSEKDFLLEIAVSLYEKEILSLGKAANLAGIHRIAFQKALAERKVPIHFSIDDINRDLKTLESLGI